VFWACFFRFFLSKFIHKEVEKGSQTERKKMTIYGVINGDEVIGYFTTIEKAEAYCESEFADYVKEIEVK
jgi:hypothetical protein